MNDPAELPPAAPQPGSLFDKPLPPGYRDELRDLIAEPPVAPPSRTGAVLHFQLGALRLALPAKVASAVAPVLHIARIPHRSDTVLLGLAAFRGEILPCCSLARVLDVPEMETQRMLILEESPGRRWAVPIGQVHGVRLQDGRALSGDAPLGKQWLRGSFQDEDGTFYLLDHDVLFRQITLATA